MSTLIDDLGLWRPAPTPPRPKDVGDWLTDIGQLVVTAVAWLVLVLIAVAIGAAVGGLVGMSVLLLALDGGGSL